MATLTVEPTEENAARLAARRMADAIAAALAARGRADVALAGGSSPRRAYELVAALVPDWQGVHLWFGDERAVPPDDPDSNYRMVAETLLARAAVPAEQVHRVLGELGADAAAGAYRDELAGVTLDLALLGMGPDGHTASLFPNAPELDAPPSLAAVAVHGAPKPPPDRVTLTLTTLRAARARILLAPGQSKAAAVAAVLAGPDPAVPASLIAGPGTELLVDAAAALARH